MAIKNISRIYFEGKIVAYMKRNGKILRYKLARIDKKYVNSKLRIKDNYPDQDPKILNAHIDAKEEEIDNAISQILYKDSHALINCKVVNAYLEGVNKLKDSVAPHNSTLLENFDKYLDDLKIRKTKEDLERGIIRSLNPSCKDYISTRNALDDYEYDIGHTLYLEDLTEDFIEDFVEFLSNSNRENTSAHKYKTKGGLVNGTINKRLDCLATFVHHHYNNPKVAEMIVTHKEDNSQTEVIRICSEELAALAIMNLETDSEKRIRDYFVFLCLTGLRFSDLITINRNNFDITEPSNPVLRLYTHKTIKRAEIKLTDRALDLATKYKFEFKHFSNPVFNRMLKVLFKKYDLYGEEAPKFKVVRRKVECVSMLRRDRMSAHTGRRTFISILVESGIPIRIIMGMTGHTREATLQIYVDKFSPAARGAMNQSLLNF